MTLTLAWIDDTKGGSKTDPTPKARYRIEARGSKFDLVSVTKSKGGVWERIIGSFATMQEAKDAAVQHLVDRIK